MRVAQLRAARHAIAASIAAAAPAPPALDDHPTPAAKVRMTPPLLPRYCLIARSGTRVQASLQQRWPLASTPGEITCLAGRRYTEPLIEMIQAAALHTPVQRLLAGLGIGRQKAWLAKQLRAQPSPQMPTP